MHLYELTQQYMDLLELLEQEPGNQALTEMLEGLEDAIEVKVENIVKIIKSLDGDSKIIADEIKRLQDRKNTIEANKERLKIFVEEQLKFAGIDKLKGHLFNVWLQNNPPSVTVIDEKQIPHTYFMTPAPVLRKSDILEAFKQGFFVPGVEIRQEKSLRVR